MKTRTLFLTLITSISILLIAQGFAFAGPITGCVKSFSGALYKVQFGIEPKGGLCHIGDETITWQEEGIQGPKGDPGDPGTVIHQVHLEDFANTDCEAQSGAPTTEDTLGWCPNGSKSVFIIPNSMITPNSVVTANLVVVANFGEALPGPPPFPNCIVRFINPTVGAFNFRCDGPVPDGLPFNYVIINPPPAP